MTVHSAGPIRFAGVSQVTASLGANDPEVGTVIREGDEEYIFVYNDGGEQIAPTYAATISTGVSGYSVTITMATGAAMGVGVVKHATITTGAYGWLCRKGFCQVEMGADNSAAAGALLGLGADGTWAAKSFSTSHPAPAYGQAAEAIASGASGTAFVCFG